MELCPRFGINGCLIPDLDAKLSDARKGENQSWKQGHYKDAEGYKKLQGKVEERIQEYVNRGDVRRVFAGCLSTCPLLLTGFLNIQYPII